MNIVVIDDDRDLASMIKNILSRRRNCEVNLFFDGKSALEGIQLLKEADFILLDIKLPDISGLDVLEEFKKEEIPAHIIVASAYADREMAIEAIRRGADEYLQKPFEIEELEFVIDKLLEKDKITSERDYLKKKLQEREPEEEPVFVSEVMKKLVETARKIAPYDTPVLITGESGTGKEVLARFIHTLSIRKNGPFVAINCGAIPSELVESELFGHEKGAFTGAYERKRGLFEIAQGGTLFLDEIAELPPDLQVKLLRVLQDGTFMRVGGRKTIKSDARIISATARDLEGEVAKGTFREDLFFRLNVIHLKIPPLRERPEDIPVLAIHFVRKYSKIHRKNIEGFTERALEIMLQYAWPGNVRELENVIERAVILTENTQISEKDLNLPSQTAGEKPPLSSASDVSESDKRTFFESLAAKLSECGLSLKNAQKVFEREYILKALEETGGNVLRASKILGISHRAVLYKIREYRLEEALESLRKNKQTH